MGNTITSDKKSYGLDGDVALEATHLIQRICKHILNDNCKCCKEALENDD